MTNVLRFIHIFGAIYWVGTTFVYGHVPGANCTGARSRRRQVYAATHRQHAFQPVHDHRRTSDHHRRPRSVRPGYRLDNGHHAGARLH